MSVPDLYWACATLNRDGKEARLQGMFGILLFWLHVSVRVAHKRVSEPAEVKLSIMWPAVRSSLKSVCNHGCRTKVCVCVCAKGCSVCADGGGVQNLHGDHNRRHSSLSSFPIYKSVSRTSRVSVLQIHVLFMLLILLIYNVCIYVLCSQLLLEENEMTTMMKTNSIITNRCSFTQRV